MNCYPFLCIYNMDIDDFHSANNIIFHFFHIYTYLNVTFKRMHAKNLHR